MMKYLNNRKDKSRANRQQAQKGAQQVAQGQGSGQQAQHQQAANQGQNQGGGGKKVVAQDHPAISLVSGTWNFLKSMLTYHPSQIDDSFSLGGRRTQANPNVFKLNQQDNRYSKQKGQNNVQSDAGQCGQSGTSPSNSGKGVNGNFQNADQVPGDNNGKQDQSEQSPEQQTGSSAEGTGAQPGGAIVQPPPGTGPYVQFYAPQDTGGQPIKHTLQGGAPLGEDPVPVEEQIHYSLDKKPRTY